MAVGADTTIDEMLEALTGRCSFQKKSKTVRYGIKIISQADSRACYTLNTEICAGKQPEGLFMVDNSAASIVSLGTI